LAHVRAWLVHAEANVLALVAVKADLLRLHLAVRVGVAPVVLCVGEAPHAEQAPRFERLEVLPALLGEHRAQAARVAHGPIALAHRHFVELELGVIDVEREGGIVCVLDRGHGAPRE
jgi:hypothetical protein